MLTDDFVVDVGFSIVLSSIFKIRTNKKFPVNKEIRHIKFSIGLNSNFFLSLIILRKIKYD